MGFTRPDETLTVECTIGSPQVFASFTVDTMFFSTTSDPWTGPRRSARTGSRSPAAPRSAASADGRRADRGSRSWVYPPAVAEVEADRLHHLERRALGEDVGGREHTRVLRDHGGGSGPCHLVQADLERGPQVLAVLDEDGRQIDAVDRLPAALGDICHVLLMQRHVVARPEPAHVAADVVLPRVRQRVRVGRDVAGDVFRQVRKVDRCPSRVDDVDEHERLVVRQVDEDVVGGVVGAVPGEVDAFAADLERPVVLERLLVGRPRGIVIAQQQPSRLLVADARHLRVEQGRRADVVGVVVRVDEVVDLIADAVGRRDLVDRALDVVADRGRCIEKHDAVRRRQERALVGAVGDAVKVPFDAADEVALLVERRPERRAWDRRVVG